MRYNAGVLSLAAFVLSVQPTIVPPPPVEPMADPLELEDSKVGLCSVHRSSTLSTSDERRGS